MPLMLSVHVSDTATKCIHLERCFKKIGVYELTANTVLNVVNRYAGATKVFVLAHVNAGGQDADFVLAVESGARGRNSGSEFISGDGDCLRGAQQGVWNGGVVIEDLGQGGGRESESEGLSELHDASGLEKAGLGSVAKRD